MAGFKMGTLWKDPRTGILKLRKRVPSKYQAIAGRGALIKITTGTADRKAAERELPRVLGEWNGLLAEWDRRLNQVAITQSEAFRLAALWAAKASMDLGTLLRPGDPVGLFSNDAGARVVDNMAGVSTVDRLAMAAVRLEKYVGEAERLGGLSASPATRAVLVDAMRPVVAAAYREAGLLETADARRATLAPLTHLRASLPAVTLPGAVSGPAPQPGQPAAVTMDSLFEAWKATAVVKPRSVAEVGYTLKLLTGFLGHDDAARITRDDLVRWQAHTKAAGKVNNTWNQRLSMLRQVFRDAAAHGRLPGNVADNGLRLRKSRTVLARLPYSDDEAVRILQACRLEETPMRRWAHWVMAFSGMRVAEVLQLTRGDVRQDGGVFFLAVNEDEAGKSVKTSQRRHVPVHPALVAEGFLTYLDTLPANGPLFPEKKLDSHGQRGGRGYGAVGKWVRETVGISDPQKAPNHSWRHRIEDELRAQEVPEDARDAIVGHARKTTGRAYGVRGEALGRLARELGKVPVPAGLEGNSAT